MRSKGSLTIYTGILYFYICILIKFWKNKGTFNNKNNFVLSHHISFSTINKSPDKYVYEVAILICEMTIF